MDNNKKINIRLNQLENRREILIEMNMVQRYVSNPKKCDQYLKLMLEVKKEIASFLRKKDMIFNKSNYQFSIPLNVFIKPL